MFNKRPAEPRRQPNREPKTDIPRGPAARSHDQGKTGPSVPTAFPMSRLAKKKNNFPPRQASAGSHGGHSSRRSGGFGGPRRAEIKIDKGPSEKVPAIAPGVIRIIPLGGVEEIGKNMTAIEIGQDIIVIDAGLAFPGDEAPGVDYIIPDTSYLEENRSRIKALVVTHGHLDHIGGIPYLIEKIGNPPIYTSLLTAVMIKKRQEEFPHLPTLNITVAKSGEVMKIGQTRCRFFAISHTVPDSMGVIIETPHGNLVFTGDIRIENENGQPVDYEVKTWGDIGKEKNLLLVADSTNVERQGFSYPEKLVQENVKEIIRNVKGRVIIGTFASLLERIIYIILAAESLGKKVAIEGRSMKTNIEIAKELGLLKVKAGTLISSDDLQNYPEDKIVIMATGAQGDEFAALMRMSQKEHKYVKIKKGDTILLSSSVIPGNEKSVQKLKDNLSRQGAKIVHYGIANVHSSGHSYQGELEWIHKMIKPRFFIPVHGHHSMLRVHADLAERLGMPEKHIVVPDNGTIIEISEDGEKINAIKAKAESKVVMVDGLGSNNVQEVVIRDRQMLAQDGMFVIIAIVDVKSGKIRKSPDIISRGFVYLKESQELLRAVRSVAKKTIEDATAQMNPINIDYVKNSVREELGKYLFQKTHKRPIILPVIIEV